MLKGANEQHPFPGAPTWSLSIAFRLSSKFVYDEGDYNFNNSRINTYIQRLTYRSHKHRVMNIVVKNTALVLDMIRISLYRITSERQYINMCNVQQRVRTVVAYIHMQYLET